MKTEQEPGPWVSTIRRETGLVENVCKCGVGHPAHASIHWLELHGKAGHGTHGCCGCCGCCGTPEWKLADAQAGCRIANSILYDTLKNFRSAATLILDLREQLLRGGKVADSSSAG